MTELLTPYMTFSREEWAAFRKTEPMTLTEAELLTLKGINEELSLDEVQSVYLPLSRLLNFYIQANITNDTILSDFLGKKRPKVPYIIGVAGSVSVGKSTTSRVLQALLQRWPQHCKVALVTTDGFLYPNRILEERGLMEKKGFPESYDIRRLLAFVSQIKSGIEQVSVPVYCHHIYDIVPNEEKLIECPDILILEGLNVLQNGRYFSDYHHLFISDYLDFSVYVDATDKLLEEWYISRFLKFRQGAFSDPNAYFHNYAKSSEDEAIEIARSIWQRINLKNLHQNILPTRERADLILIKGKQHQVSHIKLRK